MVITNSTLVREIGDNVTEGDANRRNMIILERVNNQLMIYAVRDRTVIWRGTIDDLLHVIEDWQSIDYKYN